MEDEERNYCSLVLLLLRVGTPCLRLYFQNKWNAAGRYAPWTDCTQNGADLLLMFNPRYYERNSVQTGDRSRWDLSLVISVLLRSRPPFVSAPDLVTALETLRRIRNVLCHAPAPRIANNDFERFWTDACNAITSFGGKSKDFDKVKTDVKRPWRFLLPETKGCAAQEWAILSALQSLKTEQQNLRHGQQKIVKGQSVLKQGQGIILEEMSSIKKNQYKILEGQANTVRFVNIVKYNINAKDSAQVAAGNNARFTNYTSATTSKASAPNVELKVAGQSTCQDYTKKLKASIKKQSVFLPQSRKEKKIRTDDIFTNMTIQRDLKRRFDESEQEDTQRRLREHDEYNLKSSITLLKKCSDMFISPDSSFPTSIKFNYFNPKFILVIGKAGIGKSLLCRKMVLDWADDKLFDEEGSLNVPDFYFVFLVPFRKLNPLGQEKLTLREVLNHASFLDDSSVINEDTFAIILRNPEKVLIILDGYDEYSLRDCVVEDVEEDFPNVSKERIPVPVIITKLLKGKLLKESVVLVTSRPDEASRMNDTIFDAIVEIKGFSFLQVMEYVKRYFKDDEDMKKVVLDHVQRNEKLVSFAHIPVMCYLMCRYMKWHIRKAKTTANLPNTRADLYLEVIRVFITKHHRHLKHPKIKEDKLQEIIHKLAELAVKLTEKEKYFFSEEDLRKLDNSEEEIASLKASGLLDCCPLGVKKTPFGEVELEYTFTHLSMQEFLCAFWYVNNNQTPANASHMTFMFIADILSITMDKKLVRKLLQAIEPADENDDTKRLLTLHCLRGFGDDELAKRRIKKQFNKYCNNHGWVVFSSVMDMDCPSISYLFYVIDLLAKEESSKPKILQTSYYVNTLVILKSFLSLSGAKLICESLANSTITELDMNQCNLDDNHCVQIITDLFESKVTILKLPFNHITGEDANGISRALTDRNCHIKRFVLCGNKLTNARKEFLRNRVRMHKPDLELILDDPGHV